MALRKRHAIIVNQETGETMYIVNYNPRDLNKYLGTIFELQEREYDDAESEQQEEEREDMVNEDVDADAGAGAAEDQVEPPVEQPDRGTPSTQVGQLALLTGVVGSLFGMYVLIFCMWLGSLNRSFAASSRGDEL